MSGNIFISYRRSDSAKDARALYERLRREFGDGNVFIDLEGIEPGEDFVESLERQLDGCDAVVALISRDWVEAKNEHGERRLDDPSDFVRIELAASFRRGVKVFPVLIDGARPPRAPELPEELRPLVRRQAVVLDYSKFDADVARLARAIRKALEQPLPRAPSPASPGPPTAAEPSARETPQPASLLTRRPTLTTIAALAAGVMLLALLALLWFVHPILWPSDAVEYRSAVVRPSASDIEEVKRYRAGAELGDAKSQSSLGFMYQTGRGGLPQSDSEAVKWFRLAAERGDAAGQSGLAEAYENGTGGVRRDRAEAVRLYRLSAAQGNPVATVALRRLNDNAEAKNIIQSIGR